MPIVSMVQINGIWHHPRDGLETLCGVQQVPYEWVIITPENEPADCEVCSECLEVYVKAQGEREALERWGNTPTPTSEEFYIYPFPKEPE